MHSNKIIFLFPTFSHVLIALSISLKLDRPVDKIIGFFFFATYFINSKSVISNEAILYNGTPSFSKSSTASLSHGEEKNIIFFFFYNNQIVFVPFSF